MTELERYNKAFTEVFECNAEGLSELKEWDSASQMSLIATLEDEFDIMLDTDDILQFSSYLIGKDILLKYGVKI